MREEKVQWHPYGDECLPLTDAEGRMNTSARWVALVRGDAKNSGPVHWIHENYRGRNCHLNPNHKCCKNVPPGQLCKSDGDTMADDKSVSFCIKQNYKNCKRSHCHLDSG